MPFSLRIVYAASLAPLCILAAGCAPAGQPPVGSEAAASYAPYAVGPDGHDPESEPDYAPGFFAERPGLLSEESQQRRIDALTFGAGSERWNPAWVLQAMLDRGDDQASVKVAAAMSVPQTIWNECSDRTTGQYTTAACVQRRGIALALHGFLQDRALACVSDGLRAMGDGRAAAIHLVHVGISGDPRHSPKSLHAINRAIDLAAVRARLSIGVTRQLTYSKTGNRKFYEALRSCWGRNVISAGQCPAYDGRPELTGSIGWEDSDHGGHLHLSVPDCANGAYGTRYWRR